MQPAHLIRLLTSLSAAADVVEAIDDPQLCRARGWDLGEWKYELVPWGVRFYRPDAAGRMAVSILAAAEPDNVGVILLIGPSR